MRDLGTFRGKNHPDALEVMEQSNNTLAGRDTFGLIILFAFVFAIIFGAGATVGPVAI